jgi:hypothetical protein
MANAFSWLNDLMVWLGRWVPRIILIRASHKGVRFGIGGAVVLLEPGVHWYWPIAQEVQLVSVALRTLETSAQVIDGQITSIVVTYRIVDVVKVARDLYDFSTQIDMRAKAHMAEAAKPDESPIERLRFEFDPLGIHIEGWAVTQRSWCLPLKNLQDWGMHEARTLQ